jgi:1-deoxy-D-xylulose-5-phosphate synthase
MSTLDIGKAEVRRKGKKVAILAFGSMVTPAMEAGEKLDATVVNMRFIKPLDENMIQAMAQTHDLLITVEDNAVMGGAGSAINEVLMSKNISIPVINMGIPDKFIDHGTREELLAACQLNSGGIIAAIENPDTLAGCHTSVSNVKS